MPLVYGQDERVAEWVAHQLGYPEGAPACSSIGYERDGELVAGVVFDNMSDTNVFAHIACSAEIMPVGLLSAVARYVYIQCGARRMTFLIHDNNDRCIDLVEGLGAVLEATLKMGHGHGDTYVYALWDTSRFYRKLIATGRVVEPEMSL